MLTISVPTLRVRGPGVFERGMMMATSSNRKRVASVFFCRSGPVLAVTDPRGNLGYLMWRLNAIDSDNPDRATLRFRKEFRHQYPWDFYYYPPELLRTTYGPQPLSFNAAADRVARSGLGGVLTRVFPEPPEPDIIDDLLHGSPANQP